MEVDERSLLLFSFVPPLVGGKKCSSMLLFFVLFTAAIYWSMASMMSDPLERHRGDVPPSWNPLTGFPTPFIMTNSPSPTPDNSNDDRQQQQQRLERLIRCASMLSSMDSMVIPSDLVRWKAIEYFYTGGGKWMDTNHCEDKESLFATVYSLMVVRESLKIDDPTWNEDEKQISTDLVDICQWKRLRCSTRPSFGGGGTGTVLAITDLLLNHANLDGTLPPELSGLLDLERLVAFSNPKLTGSIPTEIGRLTHMTNLQLHFTDMSGTVPSSLGQLLLLSSMFLHETNLEGSMPQEVCALHEKNGRGTLVVLEADCTRLQCDCCTKCKPIGGGPLVETETD
jgi:hypothetical protein